MIELRWIAQSSADGVEKVLQYRQQYDRTVYAEFSQFPETTAEVAWSEWREVPYEHN